MSESEYAPPVTSADLLKEAWRSMGRTETGERIAGEESASAAMTAAAGAASVATEQQRMAAEDIARVLLEEAKQREPAAVTERAPATPTRRTTVPREPRQATPPRRQGSPSRQPAPPLQPPPSRQPAPPLQPAPPRPRPTAPPSPAPSPQPEPPARDSQPRRRSARGLGWLIFGAIWLISAIAGTFISGDDSPPVTTQLVVPATTQPDLDPRIDPGAVTYRNIRDVAPGTCIATLPSSGTISEVATVSCREPHQYEMFSSVDLGGASEEYPGAEEVFARATEQCRAEFVDYVGEDYAVSEWYIDVITPTEQGWRRTADREVNCLLYLWDEDAGEAGFVSRSARDSGAAS